MALVVVVVVLIGTIVVVVVVVIVGFRHLGNTHKNPLKKPSKKPAPKLIKFQFVMPVIIKDFFVYSFQQPISNKFANF